jgi:hypothetical protein
MPDHVKNLALGRIAIGAASWAAPNLVARSMFLKPETQQALSYRLFGVRDFALGLATLDSTPEHRKWALQLGILCDVGDALAAVQGNREGSLPTPTAAITGVLASGAVGIGLLGLLGARKAAKAAVEASD